MQRSLTTEFVNRSQRNCIQKIFLPGIFLPLAFDLRVATYVGRFLKISGHMGIALERQDKTSFVRCPRIPYPKLQLGHTSVERNHIEIVDIQVNKMRRIICKCPKLDHSGKSVPISALYIDTPLFSTLHKVNRARLVGHLIRHSEIYSELMQWRVKEKSRIRSPSEACTGDMGLVVEEALVYAEDRKCWQKHVEKLQMGLENPKMYIGCRSSGWHRIAAAAQRENDLSALQYAEEGPTPFSSDNNVLHLYTDASVSSSYIGKIGIGIVEVQCGHEVASSTVCKEILGTPSPERAEFYAALLAIQRAPKVEGTIVLHTDSWIVWHFIRNTRRKYYLIGYNGLPNSDIYWDLGGAIKTLEENGVKFYVIKVKGHCGNPYNDKCDTLAKTALFGALSEKRRKTSATTLERHLSQHCPAPGPQLSTAANRTKKGRPRDATS